MMPGAPFLLASALLLLALLIAARVLVSMPRRPSGLEPHA
jgi:hypothetical protein